jgi:hypothetical protein
VMRALNQGKPPPNGVRSKVVKRYNIIR